MQVCFSILLQDTPPRFPFSILSPPPLLHSQLRSCLAFHISCCPVNQNKQFGRLQNWNHSLALLCKHPPPLCPGNPSWTFLCQSVGNALFSNCTLHPGMHRPQCMQPFVPLITAFRRSLASAHHRNDDMDILACPGVLRFPWMKPRQWEIPYPRLKLSNILPATVASHGAILSFAWVHPAGYSSSCCKCHSFAIGRN